MKLKILCPQWGHEDVAIESFLDKIIEAGYDGIELWLPEDPRERKKTVAALHRNRQLVVCHQHHARGNDISKFCESYVECLKVCLEAGPILINSHSGRDFFTTEEQLRVLDTAVEFAERHNVEIVHETHRGRMFFGPSNTEVLLKHRPNTKLCADFSHWVCVTENLALKGFESVLKMAMKNTRHIHARVGFEEGPQIGDPRSRVWEKEVNVFMNWWQKIVDIQKESKSELFTITTEFGPIPYMWQLPENGKPISSQWDINMYMKKIIKERLGL